MNEVVVEEMASLSIPDGTRETVETPPRGPATYRFFAGVVVSALSLHRPGQPTGRLAGGVIDAYSTVGGFSRTPLRSITVPGAEAAAEFDMQWTSSTGDAVTSLIRVATSAEVGVILHVSYPTVLIDNSELARDIADSIRIVAPLS